LFYLLMQRPTTWVDGRGRKICTVVKLSFSRTTCRYVTSPNIRPAMVYSIGLESFDFIAAARKTGKCVSSVCETSLLPTQDKWSVHEIHSRLERKLDDDNEPQRKKLRTQSES